MTVVIRKDEIPSVGEARSCGMLELKYVELGNENYDQGSTISDVLALVETHEKETILSKINIVCIEKFSNSEFCMIEILKFRDYKICQHSEPFSASA